MFISFKELEREQAQGLDYKIASAVSAIQKAYGVSKHRAAIAFSGGKDSTVLWHLIRTNFPEQAAKTYVIYGNTGVEYPECLRFARALGKNWGPGLFHEAHPEKTDTFGLKYKAQKAVLDHVAETGRLGEILKPDGKLKSTSALENVCPADMMEKFASEKLVWPVGTRKTYWWCVDQYGWPLLGKAASMLKARRINIDCFLKYSNSASEKGKLLAYYKLLKRVKFSQACCDILKKEPSEKLQAELDVDVVFKGLMASESRSRQTNFVTRGYLFESTREHLQGDSFWHCNPMSIWTDDDVWAYIRRFGVPYSTLYDMGYTDAGGVCRKIKRNGCMGCGTDLMYPNNHMSMLRRTHPKQWDAFMRLGMAAEIQNLQIEKRNGQMSIFDFAAANPDHADEVIGRIIDERPCVFDRIDRLVIDDEMWPGETPEYDPEVGEERMIKLT